MQIHQNYFVLMGLKLLFFCCCFFLSHGLPFFIKFFHFVISLSLPHSLDRHSGFFFFCLKRTHIPDGLRINGIHCYQSIWCALFIQSFFYFAPLSSLTSSPFLYSFRFILSSTFVDSSQTNKPNEDENKRMPCVYEKSKTLLQKHQQQHHIKLEFIAVKREKITHIHIERWREKKGEM